MYPPYARRVAVSVLVPSYNSNPYVLSALRSALAQDTADLEVVVQDGGSTDGTLDVLAGLRDDRLTLVSEPDDGQSDALNRALQRATGEFVMWLNADDLIAPGAVTRLLQAARGHSFDVVHGNYEIIDAAGAIIKGYSSAPLDHSRLIRHGTYIFSGALLIRRSTLVAIGGFDCSLHYCMDYDLLLRLASRPVAAGSVSHVVAQFRRQPDSKTESAWLPFLREWRAVGRRHGASRIDDVRTTARFTVYHFLQPLWRSRLWLRVRPRKHLGGAR